MEEAGIAAVRRWGLGDQIRGQIEIQIVGLHRVAAVGDRRMWRSDIIRHKRTSFTVGRIDRIKLCLPQYSSGFLSLVQDRHATGGSIC